MGFMNQTKKNTRIDLEKADKNNKLADKKEIVTTGISPNVAGSQHKAAKSWGSFATGNPPTISIIDPVNNAVNVATNKAITVTFSAPIKEGDMRIELSDSRGIQIPITLSISGNVLTIDPLKLLEAETKYTLNLHNGCVTNYAGINLAHIAFVFTTSTEVAPTVSSIDPDNNAVNVAGDRVITVTFSESIKEGDMWIELYSGGKVVPITSSISGNVLTINPTSPLTTGKYTLNMHTGCVTDLAGNSLALYRSSFTVDSTPPIVSLIVPVNNSVKVPRDKLITVTFRESIKEGDMWIELYSGGKMVPITSSISGNVLTINPVELLEAETKYTLGLHTGCVTDYAGNKVEPVAFFFTTISR